MWATESVLVQVTVVPWVTVNEFGEKAKFEIVTALGVEVEAAFWLVPELPPEPQAPMPKTKLMMATPLR
jgi:hypothetical protein